MAGGSPVYNDLLDLWTALFPYTMTTLVAGADNTQSILALPELRDGAAGLDFHASGRLVTPLGAQLLKSPAVPAGKVVALDKSCALEMVKAGDISTDYDRLIDRQLDRAAISACVGFAKIFPGAAAVME
jgi:hypothetical protein